MRWSVPGTPGEIHRSGIRGVPVPVPEQLGHTGGYGRIVIQDVYRG